MVENGGFQQILVFQLTGINSDKNKCYPANMALIFLLKSIEDQSKHFSVFKKNINEI